MVSNVAPVDFKTQLTYPAHWKQETVNTYERLFTLGKVDQAEIDRIEARLQWFRSLKTA